MVKQIRRIHNVLAIATLGVLLSHPAMAAGRVTGNLVTGTWLRQNLRNPEVIVLDASPAQIYATKHIPGAVSVARRRGHHRPDRRRSEEALRRPVD